ncbi:MAG: ABC transporter ATP-binding protein [Clostridium perfringens]|nr:ABC transporter ATP-binding protein [Clostridium perfringens]
MSNKNKNNPQGGGMGIGGGPKHKGSPQKAKDFKKAMKSLLSYLKPYRLSLVVVIIFAILSSVFSIVGPKILGNATTEIYTGIMGKILGTNSAGINFEAIGKILLVLLALYILSAGFSYIQSYIVAGVVQKMSYDFRKQISEKMNRMPLKYFDKRSKGDVLSILTNDVGMISENLNQSLTQVITSIVTLIGVLIMMFSISWIMTLIAIIILPVSGLLMGAIVKKSQKYFGEQQQYLGKVNGEVEEIYGGHNVVKAFNGEESAYESFEKLNKTLYASAWKSQFLSGLMMPIMNFIGNVGYVLMSIVGGYLTILGVIQVGDILAFIQYIRSFTQPIAQLTQVANLMQTTAAACERVFEFLDEEEEVQVLDNPVRDIDIQGNVSFKDVSFGYNEDKIIINDFTANIKAGQRVAIVGPTGAGKTTIVKLLMRFYDINKGSIMIDGHDIRDFNRNDLRELFGMVLQETWLYNGSIMENIRYGKLTSSDKEVIEAAKAAHANHFIEALPDGYNMELNEEASNISQGQKQLLTIARAILADPKILILDEATSSVDTRTEVLIQKAMDNLMRGRTSFIIAHRLSTIQDADLILVMKDGDIIEQGNHEELIAKNGFYASLYNSQFDNASA